MCISSGVCKAGGLGLALRASIAGHGVIVAYLRTANGEWERVRRKLKLLQNAGMAWRVSQAHHDLADVPSDRTVHTEIAFAGELKRFSE
jgi:hypothetical protein